MLLAVLLLLSITVDGKAQRNIRTSPGYNDWTQCPYCRANYRWEDFKLHVQSCGNRPNGNASGDYASSSNPGAQTCFIATAAYGTSWEPNVLTLRTFRERYLLPNAAGRWFVTAYYQTSPPIADYVHERPWARGVTRIALTPIVAIAGTLTGNPTDTWAVITFVLLCAIGFSLRRSLMVLASRIHLRMRSWSHSQDWRRNSSLRAACLLLSCALLASGHALIGSLSAADTKPNQSKQSSTKSSLRCQTCGKAIESGNLCPACTALRKKQTLPPAGSGNSVRQAPIELKLPSNVTPRDSKMKLPYETRGTSADPNYYKQLERERWAAQQGLMRYGNWYGPGWSGGVETDKNNGQMGSAPPVDSMDEAAKRHDFTYERAEKMEKAGNGYGAAILTKAADVVFVKDLEALSDDPKQWRNPPIYPELAANYRSRAITSFKAKTAAWDTAREEWQKIQEAVESLQRARNGR